MSDTSQYKEIPISKTLYAYPEVDKSTGFVSIFHNGYPAFRSALGVTSMQDYETILLDSLKSMNENALLLRDNLTASELKLTIVQPDVM